MPTKRRRRSTARQDRVTPELYAWFAGEGEMPVEVYMLRREELEHCWQQVREAILATWAAERPGLRPSAWWNYDAPRQPIGTWPDCFWDGKLQEPREQLGGTGVTCWDAGLAHVPHYDCGIPTSWDSFDENDPPQFESQASYLKRHKLLSSREEKALTSSEFEPEHASAKWTFRNYDSE